MGNLSGVNDQLKQLMIDSIKDSPIDFGIPNDGGLRSSEKQYELYKRGKSLLDGNIKKSKHQTGEAVDIYAYVNGKASWDDVHLAMVAGVVLSKAKERGLQVRWGGEFGSKDFNGWDKPHFELI